MSIQQNLQPVEWHAPGPTEYNAGMGAANSEIDAWLREGGMVVTASDRAARAVATAYHRARQNEGLTAWPAPNVLDWKSFVRGAWNERASDARLVLNPSQEQALWAEIAGSDRSLATLLEGPRHRLAKLAMEAHELLCSYAPRLLREQARATWQQDAAAFSGWLAAFDEICRAESLISPGRLPHELIPLLGAELALRPPLLLAGFDRILPAQRSLFDAWGEWREIAKNNPTSAVHFHAAADAQSELASCAIWCGRQLDANPNARLLVVTQGVGNRRGEIERAFLRYTGPIFEFSLGVPLRQVALARAAYLSLRWLDGALAEHELDWLFSTGYAVTEVENAALQARMRALRRYGLERTQWTLAAFLDERSAAELLPAHWVERVTSARNLLADFARRPQSPLDWAELVPRLLDELHFAAARPLSSAEFQAQRRWRQAVEGCGSLGFDGRRISWREFLSLLDRALDETLFAPESQDAPIQIAGPAESAGLAADAVWFLGADEDSWPANGSTNPLLPIELQREAGMPHATSQHDWELAAAITERILISASEIHFSFAQQNEKAAEARPSRLILQVAGPAQLLPPRLIAHAEPVLMTVIFDDDSRIPFTSGKVRGGAEVLTSQSQCPFKAFATARLAAHSWEPAQAGLTPSQRGNLLHAVLLSVWSDPQDGIRSGAELQRLSDIGAFVAAHVQRAFAQKLHSHLRELMPRRYLELEAQRLIRLVAEWLQYEATRIEFEVAETEAKRSLTIAGLRLNLRLDRVDRLNDGSLLVIDYKTGSISPKSWELPRPDDVQLPLYAGFALNTDEALGGLVFAKVRAGEQEFAGKLFDSAATLFVGLKGTSSLMKNRLDQAQLEDWREAIEALATDFLSGRADVNPREAPKTCQRCGLQTLCRIQESPVDESDSEFEEAGDE